MARARRASGAPRLHGGRRVHHGRHPDRLRAASLAMACRWSGRHGRTWSAGTQACWPIRPRAACSTFPCPEGRHATTQLQASRRLHGDAVSRQSARRGARWHGSVRRARCSTSRAGPTCRRRLSCCRPTATRPTTACASSRPAASCRSPAIRRSAVATPGWKPAASRAGASSSCRNARSAWSGSAATARGWPSPRRRSSAARPAPRCWPRSRPRSGLKASQVDRRADPGQRPGLAGAAAGQSADRAQRSAPNHLRAQAARDTRSALPRPMPDAARGHAAISRCGPSPRRSASPKTRSPAA